MDQFSFDSFPNTDFNQVNLDWLLEQIAALNELVLSGRYGVPPGGATGQVLGKTGDEDFQTGWIDQSGGGGGGTTNYNQLSNKPLLNGVELSGNKSSAQLGITAPALGAYQKPSGGIPKTDLASAVQTSLGKADSAYQKPTGGIPKTDLATSVQTSLGKADSALQSVPSTYRTAAAQDTIDASKISKPSNPATGAFLVWDGSSWTAQTLSVWQGGNY